MNVNVPQNKILKNFISENKTGNEYRKILFSRTKC